MTPRIECACHPVASINSLMVAPLGLLNRAMSWDCLVLGDVGITRAELVNGVVNLSSFGFEFVVIAFLTIVLLGANLTDLVITFLFVALRMIAPGVVIPLLG
ncbi:hypothetical protein [Polynucleobacter sp. P1-05-14]|uniref:hypothetical protein n=1 Tax=Polynucleobacter sp. P1-05-14 TaxID=1819732 RepID=UPI002103DE7E|nr:hypothetical protein [Polynucleobacter sp. P1-05-14]